jgi:hypothetical protein
MDAGGPYILSKLGHRENGRSYLYIHIRNSNLALIEFRVGSGEISLMSK